MLGNISSQKRNEQHEKVECLEGKLHRLLLAEIGEVCSPILTLSNRKHSVRDRVGKFDHLAQIDHLTLSNLKVSARDRVDHLAQVETATAGLGFNHTRTRRHSDQTLNSINPMYETHMAELTRATAGLSLKHTTQLQTDQVFERQVLQISKRQDRIEQRMANMGINLIVRPTISTTQLQQDQVLQRKDNVTEPAKRICLPE